MKFENIAQLFCGKCLYNLTGANSHIYSPENLGRLSDIRADAASYRATQAASAKPGGPPGLKEQLFGLVWVGCIREVTGSPVEELDHRQIFDIMLITIVVTLLVVAVSLWHIGFFIGVPSPLAPSSREKFFDAIPEVVRKVARGIRRCIVAILRFALHLLGANGAYVVTVGAPVRAPAFVSWDEEMKPQAGNDGSEAVR